MSLIAAYEFLVTASANHTRKLFRALVRASRNFNNFILIIPVYIIQKTAIREVVVQPIIYRKKFTVFQRGAVDRYK